MGLKLQLTLFSLLLALSAFQTSSAFEMEEGTGIWLLTELDFHKAIQENDYVLVNFHALWCRYSKQLKPIWANVSQALQKEEVKIFTAKVEAYDEKKIAEEYGVEGFPTIKFFIHGEPHDYNGERNLEAILEFVHRKLRKSLTVVKKVSEIEDKLKEYEWVAILVGDDKEESLRDVAFNINDVLFVRTDSDEIKKNYGDAKNGDFIFVNNITKSYYTFSDPFTATDLTKFIEDNKFPGIPKFSKGTAEKIFLNEDPAMIFIRKDSSSDLDEAFKGANAKIGSKIFMSIASYDEEIGKLLADNIGVKEQDLPAVRIVRADRERIRKYYMEGAVDAENIIKFYEDYINRKAKRSYLSEPVPTEDVDLVKKVVTLNFQEKVLNPDTDVLLLIWAPWCGHCRAMMPVYDNVARKTREVENFLVAKVDASVNDLEGFGLDIVEYPTILLFTRKDKPNPIEFKGERNEYVFNDFIRAHATVNLARMKGPNPFDKNEL